ncbi:hypothetical protein [Thermococcus thioreducens]|uniref:Uncharacterized protein n=1 Tax=Thermococcus thioreducens TaxID=277988 RepID=A0A0Q2QPW8_9EURY|nr:hypothetical protein [Thermococcus thioreducens]ASJ11761.1 hypothetical protein A3L14_02140 [Thermococcus thioreducens]KQH81949.1 hypothetical protein AMR53_08395 [Thermococcus thioreducens]SEW14329.1 hypothetical protein SAMN05216170_1852 [Thermococcus thioreducens]
MAFRVVRDDVPFKINLNVNDYVPTTLIINNEAIGGCYKMGEFIKDTCDLSELVSDLVRISVYFLRKIYGTSQNNEEHLERLYQIANPEPTKSWLESWHETIREFNIKLTEDVIAYYIAYLGFYYSSTIFILRGSGEKVVDVFFKSWGTENCPEWVRKRKEGEIVRVTVKLRDFVTDVIQLAEEYLEMLEERKKYLNRKILANTKLSEELSPEEEIKHIEELKRGTKLALFLLKELFDKVFNQSQCDSL